MPGMLSVMRLSIMFLGSTPMRNPLKPSRGINPISWLGTSKMLSSPFIPQRQTRLIPTGLILRRLSCTSKTCRLLVNSFAFCLNSINHHYFPIPAKLELWSMSIYTPTSTESDIAILMGTNCELILHLYDGD